MILGLRDDITAHYLPALLRRKMISAAPGVYRLFSSATQRLRDRFAK
jgi:hypothetical protein